MGEDELSLKQAAMNIIDGLRSKQQWQETNQALGRLQQSIPSVAESLVRGGVAQVPGAFGDIEGLGRAGINWAAGKEKVSPQTVLPTTNDILGYVPRITPDHEGSDVMQEMGGFIAPGMAGVAKDVIGLTRGMPVGNMMIGSKSKLWNPEWEAAYNARVPAGQPDPLDMGVWRDTKTYRGTDGLLRQELDDSKMMANFTPTPGSRAKQTWDEMQALRSANNPDPNITFPEFKDMDSYSKKSLTRQAERDMSTDGTLSLGANVTHPTVFEAYPGMEDLKFSGKRGQESGFYAPGREIKAVNTGKEGLTSVTAHEMQHAIQQVEGFGRGGSPSRSAPFSSEEAWGNQAHQLKFMENRIAQNEAMLERLRGGEQIPYSDITKNPEHTQPIRESYLNDQIRTDNYNSVQQGRHASYLAEPGEAESRMVQARLRMNADERMRNHPLNSYDMPLHKVKSSMFPDPTAMPEIVKPVKPEIVDPTIDKLAQEGISEMAKAPRFSIMSKEPVTEASLRDEIEAQLPQKRDVSIPMLQEAFRKAMENHLSLSSADQAANVRRANESLAQHLGVDNTGATKDLLGTNAKLNTAITGYKGGEPIKLPDGRGIETSGLALSPAYKEGKFNTCPNSASCAAECLGKTSGNYFKVGGGTDMSAFKGPRLNSLNKTLAMMNDPENFAVKLHDEISTAKYLAEKRGNHLAVRLNVLSDIHPKVHESIINAHPDVSFYDYTKNNTDPIAPNHHYTYSSTGVSQPAGINGNAESVINDHSNWKQMRTRLDKGDNVAMAFSDKDHLPEFVTDQESGKRYKVVNGVQHDATFLHMQPEGADGVIIGLKNKKATGKVNEAYKDSHGFFVHYDPKLQTNELGKLARGESTGLDKNGKPKLGPTTPTNREVYISPQGKRTISLTNEGEPS